MGRAAHPVVKLLLEVDGVTERRQPSFLHRFVEVGLESILSCPGRSLFHVAVLAIVVKPKPDKLLFFWIGQKGHQDVGGLMKGAADDQALVVNSGFGLHDHHLVQAKASTCQQPDGRSSGIAI